MSVSPTLRVELYTLLESLREQEITDAQLDRLSQIIRQDESARRTYVDYVDLCARLRWTFADRSNFVAADLTFSSDAQPHTVDPRVIANCLTRWMRASNPNRGPHRRPQPRFAGNRQHGLAENMGNGTP